MSDTSNRPRRAELASRLLVLALGTVFLVGLLGFISAVLSAGEAEPSPALSAAPSPAPTSAPSPAATSVTGSSDLLVGSGPRILLALAEASTAPAAAPVVSPLVEDPSPSPDGRASMPSPAGETTPTTSARVPVVAVDDFWTRRAGLARGEVLQALRQGELKGYRRVVVEDGIREALAASLGIEISESVGGGDAGAVALAVARGALGFLGASDLPPRVKALEIDGRSLFGNGRVRDLEAWPLVVALEADAGEGWDQADTWVLVAGGDSFTDRGVYDQVVRKGRGLGFPFAGGTARVTGHGCCDPVFGENVVPRYELTGDKGAVRRLLRSAELAILNHEAPVTDGWAFHRSGLRFSGRPDLTRIFVRAGIDWVSLANNHIKDYGSEGIRDTRRILRRYGIGFGGAGKDLAQARRISYLEAGDTRLAIVPCVGVVRFAWAGPRESGGTPCLDRYLVPDIKKASRKADLVIVFPHWGVEYTRKPLPSMRKHAARWVKAGADLILGAHSHVAGAIEDIDGRPVLYSLGNLIFDQHWSTNTMESVLLEATFHGAELKELRLHPYIIHAQSQPNLLDARNGEGRRLLRQMRAASRDWLDW